MPQELLAAAVAEAVLDTEADGDFFREHSLAQSCGYAMTFEELVLPAKPSLEQVSPAGAGARTRGCDVSVDGRWRLGADCGF